MSRIREIGLTALSGRPSRMDCTLWIGGGGTRRYFENGFGIDKVDPLSPRSRWRSGSLDPPYESFGEDVLDIEPPVLEAFVAETGV